MLEKIGVVDRFISEAGYQRVMDLQGVNYWEFGDSCPGGHKHLLLKRKMKSTP